jgi:hypothetical protein
MEKNSNYVHRLLLCAFICRWLDPVFPALFFCCRPDLVSPATFSLPPNFPTPGFVLPLVVRFFDLIRRRVVLLISAAVKALSLSPAESFSFYRRSSFRSLLGLHSADFFSRKISFSRRTAPT